MDGKLLVKRAREKGYSIDQLAKAIGRDPSTVWRKLKRPTGSFTVEEANAICDLLKLNGRESIKIFFTDEVASTQQIRDK